MCCLSLLSGLSAEAHKKMGNKQEKIPEGKGPYSVGCTDLMTGPGIQGSFLRLYYPSQNDTSCEDTVWIPKKEYYYGLCDFMNVCRTMGQFVLSRYVGPMTCPAKWDAAFKPGERYPLIIFSHGLGAFRTLYSTICIEMASRGFVVASVEHRDQSASATYYYKEKPSPEVKGAAAELQEEWMYYRKSKPSEEDTALRRKQDSIDGHRIAVMGHSFGAATAIETLSKDTRFKCGVALDAWMLPLSDEVYDRVHQPVLLINSEKFQWAANLLEMQKLASANRETKMITIKGTVHQSFTDFTFLSGSIVGKIFKLRGELDPNVAIDTSNEASLAFLQKHLGLHKDFDQWDQLVEGKGPNVIPGTNVELPPSTKQ
ncbi:PREDICTED: platelet-activating factor acetylhydrolase isoform X2 [Gekko japonicus]|uniref:Platelet-activating factor acetylhydrolase n=1 Tax=Gekko japonicus TaxID=146911 RepID=A0ABM1JKA2_GEKJA|nr:PREDICTED: platelet-activating factor acetylhydrolase isoform X2 [Gekko japonicus]